MRCRAFLVSSVVIVGGCFQSGDDLAGYYEHCDSTADCVRSADACYTVDWIDGRGKMCSGYCERHAECPGDSSCWELVGDPDMRSICYSRCLTTSDCDFGFECTDALVGTTVVDAICLPFR